jgi:hypothetical protein
LVQVATPGALAPNDSVDWSQHGGDQTSIFQNLTWQSLNSLTITSSLAGGNGTVARVCPAAPSCSWTTSGTGMSAGDYLFWASDPNQGTGALTLSFPLLSGVGFWIQADAVGQFTAQIQAFNGSTLEGTFTATSDANGDPVFLGVRSDNIATNITKVVISLTSCGFKNCDLNDFAIGSLLLRDPVITTAEPSSLFLIGGGLVLLGWKHRRRRSHDSEENAIT